MNNFELIKSETKDLTQEIVQEFLALEASPTDREVSASRIKHLAAKAANGTLVTFNWSIANLDGKRLRMNGQHSSLMLRELDGNFPQGLKAHIDEYRVNNKQDLALLFRQFDDRKSGRSTDDVSGAYQGLVEPLAGVPRKLAKIAIEGIAWWRMHIEALYVGAQDDKYAMFNETGYHPFILWIGDLLSVKTRELERPAVIAAIYATFCANEKEARAFWKQVSRGGPEYEDTAPATILDKWLTRSVEEPNGLRPGQYYNGCLYGWNAYRDGRSLKEIRYDTKRGNYPVSD